MCGRAMVQRKCELCNIITELYNTPLGIQFSFTHCFSQDNWIRKTSWTFIPATFQFYSPQKFAPHYNSSWRGVSCILHQCFAKQNVHMTKQLKQHKYG